MRICIKFAIFDNKRMYKSIFIYIFAKIQVRYMIQEIRIQNFMSFKNEVVFNFEASGDTFAEDFQVVKINDHTRLLRCAIVYGYNASGKSNLLTAFDFLGYFWSYIPVTPDSGTYVRPFRLDSTSFAEPSKFSLVFYVDEMKYCYQLELDTKQVYFEKLVCYKSAQPTMLFERRLRDGQSEIEFNTKNGDKVSQVVQEKITVECLNNMSFFVARDKANANLPLIDAAKNWMRGQVMEMISPQTDLTNYAQSRASIDKGLVNYILDFLKEADFNITNIDSDTITRSLSEEGLKYVLENERIPNEEKERIKAERTLKRIKTTFEHTVEAESGSKVFQFSTNEESVGTLRTFGIETALYSAIQAGAFLPIDEIETSLHHKLLEKILFEYLKTKSRSQVLIATHNDGLLDLVNDLIRKDSIWFTEKDGAGVTELYKLTDFRGVNRLTSIREAYRNKRFGATMGNGK